MARTTEMTPARRLLAAIAKDLAELPEARQKHVADYASWVAQRERQRRERDAQLAAGKWPKVSFTIPPEQFRVLQALADANDKEGRGSFKPGNVVHQLLIWVMPALEQLAASGKDCNGCVGLELRRLYGEPWLPSSGLGLVKPEGGQ